MVYAWYRHTKFVIREWVDSEYLLFLDVDCFYARYDPKTIITNVVKNVLIPEKNDDWTRPGGRGQRMAASFDALWSQVRVHVQLTFTWAPSDMDLFESALIVLAKGVCGLKLAGVQVRVTVHYRSKSRSSGLSSLLRESGSSLGGDYGPRGEGKPASKT